jgi:hypothetical protein
MDGAVPAAPYYERASTTLLARTPAIIPERWSEDGNEDWQDMRNHLEQLLLGLRNWRTPWWLHWGECAANILPRRYFWLITPNNMTRGLPINTRVLDSTPTQAVQICASGMMDGLSSPTKRWFKMKPAVEGFEPDVDGERWLADLEQLVYDILSGSNYYDSKHQMYEDQIVFGTAPMLIYEHRDRIINCINPAAGEFYLAVGHDLEINTFVREFTMTTRQAVEMFGPDALEGTEVGQLWNTKGANLETEVVVAHCIEPNYPANMPGQKNLKLGVVPGGYAYREYYWIRGKSTPRPLSVRGFHERPYQCPRWNTRGNDAYGRSPGMDALPDVKQLHEMVARLNEAIDKMVRPPMLADVSLKNEPSSIQPGRVTYVANLGRDTGMRPTYTVNPQVNEMMQAIQVLKEYIRQWFFVDVFMMISQMEGIQPRNELELSERRGEKLLRLGPVIERNLAEDARGINRIVGIANRLGLVRPMPRSMAGVGVRIHFVSKLAQIQQASDTAAMERTISLAGRMEQAKPGTLDNINADRFIRLYGQKIEFPPEVWSTDQEMAQIKQQRAQQQQQIMASHHMQNTLPAATGAAKDLSQTDTGGGINALQMLLGNAAAGPAGGGR